MRIMTRINYITWLLLFLSSVAFEVSGAEVRMSVETPRGKRSIALGDKFYLTIECVNMDASPDRPANVPGARLLYFDRTGSSSSFTSINGKTSRSSSTTWTATLKAEKEGSFSFGPISVGGVKSNRVNYSIGKAAAAPSSSASSNGGAAMQGSADADDGKPKFIGHGDQNLFLRANVTKTNVYEQEALVYTVKLYTTYDAVKFIGATAAPKFDGFVVEESKDISQTLNYETYQGKTYATAVIARYIIFPQMTGSLKIKGNTYTISVDRREYYQDPFWGSLSVSQPLQLNVTPNDLAVNVKALPVPRPADFCGGVGRFSISSNLKGTDFRTNQTASVVYTISGTGNVKYVQMPDLAVLYPPQLEIYTPTSTPEITVGSSSVSGKMVFDYSFMPLEEGDFKIPPVKIVYFNPETGKYESAEARGYNLHVGKGSGSAKSQERKKLHFDQKLDEVKESGLRHEHRSMVRGFLFWLWYIVPFVALAGSVAGWYRYRSQHADMAAFNSRRADKLAARRLKRAAAAMKKGNRELFYDELLKALWGYLGDKMKMPTSELMRDNIRAMLAEKNVGEQESERMISMLDNAEFAKYSSAGGASDMQKDYREAIDVINGVEKSFNKVKQK